MAETVNIGKEIQEEMTRQGRTVTWLSKQLGTSRTACYRMFNCYSIDTHLLLRVSVLLGRDFFSLYSASLRQEMKEGHYIVT